MARGAVAPFRDASEGKRAYLQELRAEQERGRLELSRAYARIRAARVSRAVAGAALTATGVVVFAAALFRVALDGDVHRHRGGGLTDLLLAGWGVAALMYVAARVVARLRWDARLRAELALTGDVDQDLELARRPVAQIAHGLATRPERASLVWPLVGLALVMPLTLHYVAASVLGEPGVDHSDYDQWIVTSALLVGHCHAYVAVRSYRFARAFTAAPALVDPGRIAASTWGGALAASLFPGLILFAVPTLLVALTGVFIPFAFAIGSATVTHERDLLRGEAIAASAA